MRVHLNISPTSVKISHNYQPLLTSAIHKWLGSNHYHDDVSLYSFSWLQKVKAERGGLSFPNGSSFFISSYNNEFLGKLIEGIKADPQIGNSLNVNEVMIQCEPEFSSCERFFTASPILIKRKDNNHGERHFTFSDSESDKLITQTLKTRLQKAGFDDTGVNARFDRNYHSPKTKLIRYKSLGYKVSICPVIVTGNNDQIAFAWNVGLGNSTGIGFGALK